MKNNSLLLGGTIIFAFPLFIECTYADSGKLPPPEGWSGEIGLGYIRTSGNTNTETIIGHAKGTNEHEKWRHSFKIEAINTSDSGVTTAERYFLSAKSDYKYSKFNFWYGTVSYDDDKFSGFDYRISASVGYGRRLVEEKTVTLDAEFGPGIRQTKLDNGESDSEFLLRFAGNLEWKISDTSNFSEELVSEVGEFVTVTKSVTGLKTNINSSLATKVSYTVKNTSDVPPGVKNTDTEFVVTLVYSYK